VHPRASQNTQEPETQEAKVTVVQPTSNPTQEPKEVEVSREVAVNEFSINIPSINASSDVVYGVDPFDQDEYLGALKRGVAHATGTKLPGQGGRVYLFAHSTNSPLNFTEFNAVFYQLRLLQEGDIIETSLNDELYKYEVKEKHIVDASDTHWLTETADEDELVLQTCDPPGTTLRRLLVVAERV